ncbi:MAG TPA: DotU family type IV/VI secretion system protein [Gemmatales bacterium]|nr:DotU family type IV/VI secretion system protein [Gemmatales bacterium]
MRQEIADLVYPVITYALSLKERLELGERPDMEMEQGALKGRIDNTLDARRLVDYAGETSAGYDQSMMTQAGGSSRRDQFLGIRYALACWLDEIFILDPIWGSEWNERKFETALFGTNMRATEFWTQARRAETRTTTDALEVFFLCVMLGFRGELRERPDEMQRWVSVTQNRINKAQAKEYAGCQAREFDGNATPRHGLERARRMLKIVGAGVILLIAPAVFFLFQLLQ